MKFERELLIQNNAGRFWLNAEDNKQFLAHPALTYYRSPLKFFSSFVSLRETVLIVAYV